MPYDASWDNIDQDSEVGVSTDEYVPTSAYPPPVPMGRYDVQGVPDKFVLGSKDGQNAYVKNGIVQVVGGELDGRKVDAFISSFPRKYGEPGSDLDDFLRGAGRKPAGKKFTLAEVGQGVEETWSAIRKARVNWRGYCKNCGKTVARGRGSDKFPGFEVDGEIKTSIKCPHCGELVKARAEIVQWFTD